MPTFCKKPVEVEAVRWDGDNHQEIHDFTNGAAKFRGDVREGWELVIPTLEGNHLANVGDWIIRGVQGEFYPCKPDIFEATYDPARRMTDALFAAPEAVEKSATLSPDRRYRYSLERRWGDGPMVLWIMLNPSTADADVDDRTIGRCMGFARDWGYDGIIVCNLYAWRATKPADMPDDTEAVAPIADPMACDRAIYEALPRAGRIIIAWGANAGPVPSRARNVLAYTLYGYHVEALELTKNGQPRHPLYVKGDTEPITVAMPPTGGA